MGRLTGRKPHERRRTDSGGIIGRNRPYFGKGKTPKESFEADPPDYEELMKETDRVLSELHTQEPEQKETSKPVMELSFPVQESEPSAETNIAETEQEPDKPEQPKKHAGKWIGDIAFYLF